MLITFLSYSHMYTLPCMLSLFGFEGMFGEEAIQKEENKPLKVT